jgi:hypothetical protein
MQVDRELKAIIDTPYIDSLNHVRLYRQRSGLGDQTTSETVYLYQCR